MSKMLKSKFQAVTSPLTGERFMVDLIQELGMEIPEEFQDDHIPQEWIGSDVLRQYFKEMEGFQEEDLHPADECHEEAINFIQWMEEDGATTDDDDWSGWEPDDIDHGAAFLRHWSDVSED